MYQNTVQPPICLERGRKHIGLIRITLLISCIDTYLPREGPETFIIAHVNSAELYFIATYLPREGPETLLQHLIHEYLLKVQPPIYLARGRKLSSKMSDNEHSLSVQTPICLERGRKQYYTWDYKNHAFSPYISLSTSRGAGNLIKSEFVLWSNSGIDTYLPREGPEISLHPSQCYEHNLESVQLPINLARGRKHLVCSRFKVTSIGIDTYLPRKGPETNSNLPHHNQNVVQDTYLPQEGSETVLRNRFPCANVECIATYLSREGPELGQGTRLQLLSFACIDTYQPREGPETNSLVVLLLDFLWYSPLSTSRGAGNSFGIKIRCCLCLYKNLSTSRGAGNANQISRRFIRSVYRYLSTSRGAGNIIITASPNVLFLYRYLPTSRGAGNDFSVVVKFVIFGIDTYLPREGPETAIRIAVIMKIFLYSSLSTSGGVGNSKSQAAFDER